MSRSLSHGHHPRSIQQNILPANRHHGIGENIVSSPVSHNSCICKDSVFNQFMQVFFILITIGGLKKAIITLPSNYQQKYRPVLPPKPFIPPVSPLPISLIPLSCLYSSTLITPATTRVKKEIRQLANYFPLVSGSKGQVSGQ